MNNNASSLRRRPRRLPHLALAATLLAPAAAHAQLKLESDDVWRHVITAGLTHASGNSDSLAMHLNAELGVQNAVRKWVLYGRGVYGRNDGETSTQNGTLGTLMTRELTGNWFGFGSLEWFRDRLANLDGRTTLNAGPGYHLHRDGAQYWDVFAGAGYIYENYREAVDVGGRMRGTYSRMEAMFGTESLLQLTPNTHWKQRFVIYPNLDDTGTYRAALDTSLSVAMTNRLAFTASLAARHNSDPGDGIRRNDILFVTGITLRSH